MAVHPLRVAGGVLLLSGVLTLLGIALSLPAGAVGSPHRSLWVTAHLLIVAGAALGLLGLPAIYARQYEAIGLWGMIGFGLLFIGFLGIGAFLSGVQTFLLPWVYDKGNCALGCNLLNASSGPPLLGLFYLIANLATFVGLIVFGVASARAAILPRGAGYIMAAAGVLGLIVAYAPFEIPSPVGLVPEIVAFIGVGWMAFVLTAEDGRSNAAVTRSPSTITSAR